MGGGAQKAKMEQWGLLDLLVYMIVGFLIPIVGLCVGIYGICHRGKRCDGLLILCAGLAGVIYMPRLLLLAFFVGGALL